MRTDACRSTGRLPSIVWALHFCDFCDGCTNAADGHTDDQPYSRAHSDTDSHTDAAAGCDSRTHSDTGGHANAGDGCGTAADAVGYEGIHACTHARLRADTQ